MQVNDYIVKVNKDGKDEKYSLVDFIKNKTKLDFKTTYSTQKQNPIKIEICSKQDETKVIETIPDAVEFVDFEIPDLNRIKNKELRDVILETILVQENEKEFKKISLDFAKLDYEIVHREIMDIKSCRTNIFVGTLGIIGAAGIAILGILGAKESGAPLLAWLPWAASIPVALLTSAIIATIHKARGINERIGYMEALSKHLMKTDGPEFYRGWPQANYVSRHCRIYRDSRDLSDKCPIDVEKKHCIDEAEIKSYKEINKYVKWKPDLLSSFTSLSTHIYTVAYVIAVITLLWATMASIQSYYISKAQTNNYFNLIFWIIVIVGGAITAVLAVKIMKMKHINREDCPKKVKQETWYKWCAYISSVIVPLLIIGLIISYRIGMPASLLAMLGYILGGLISIIAVFLAYSFYEKVNSLRRGIYSINCWRHIWELRFNRCKLMVGETPKPPNLDDIKDTVSA